jgi:hypothetical protein
MNELNDYLLHGKYIDLQKLSRLTRACVAEEKEAAERERRTSENRKRRMQRARKEGRKRLLAELKKVTGAIRKEDKTELLVNALREGAPTNTEIRGLILERFGVGRCLGCNLVCSGNSFVVLRGKKKVQSRSCRDCRKKRARSFKDDKYTPREFISRLVAGARSRNTGVPVEISIEWAMARFDAHNGLCELCGEAMETTINRQPVSVRKRFLANPLNISLDQTRPGEGYTKANVALVHTRCNLMKNDLDLDLFRSVCKKIGATTTPPQ